MFNKIVFSECQMLSLHLSKYSCLKKLKFKNFTSDFLNYGKNIPLSSWQFISHSLQS